MIAHQESQHTVFMNPAEKKEGKEKEALVFYLCSDVICLNGVFLRL